MLSIINYPLKYKLIGSKEELTKELIKIIKRKKEIEGITYFIDANLLDGRRTETITLYHIIMQVRKLGINFIFIYSDKIDENVHDVVTCESKLEFRDLITRKVLRTCEL